MSDRDREQPVTNIVAHARGAATDDVQRRAVDHSDDVDVEPHILIAYDGSPQAAEAITIAARLFRRAPTMVLYAWKPSDVALGALTFGPTTISHDVALRDRRSGERVAEEGARLARAQGLLADGQAEQIVSSGWRTIVDAAERTHVAVIVMGTRGRSGVRSLVLGSWSHHVAQHATCPVLIVPAREMGRGRRAMTRADGGQAHVA
jgi:nucleotide-binding universal stress UspA family protein